MSTTEVRIADTLSALESAVRNAGIFMSGDGRISEADACALVGYSNHYLKQLRHEGRGPTAYGIGMNGSRISYRLTDIAEWIESKRENFDEVVANS